MKKVIIAEIIILLALLVAAGCMLGALLDGGAAPAISTEPVIDPTTEATTEATTQTTEPEPTWMTLPPSRQLTAKQYFVYDVDADTFLTISGDENERIYPASVTKLFTCYVALQFLQPDQLITVGDELDMVAAGSSVAELRKGDKLTVSQLVEAMLLPSGNDAAHVLATNAGRSIKGNSDATAQDYVAAFMEEMNRQTKEVGMTGANFANPDGIHRSNHYMTFRDLAVLGKLSVENSTIMKNALISNDIVDFQDRGEHKQTTEVYGGSTTEELSPTSVKWKNTNALIDPVSQYYCPYATGLKTGQTPSAGSCLLSSFAYMDKQYIIGVFGCPDVDARFEDTLQLFNQTIGIS